MILWHYLQCSHNVLTLFSQCPHIVLTLFSQCSHIVLTLLFLCHYDLSLGIRGIMILCHDCTGKLIVQVNWLYRWTDCTGELIFDLNLKVLQAKTKIMILRCVAVLIKKKDNKKCTEITNIKFQIHHRKLWISIKVKTPVK